MLHQNPIPVQKLAAWKTRVRPAGPCAPQTRQIIEVYATFPEHGINHPMERSHPHDQRGILTASGAAGILSALLLALCLLLPLASSAATDNSKATTYEDRATAEKMSRSRYRNLEVASLVVILVAGGVAILWAVRRRKP
jgi:hypothetical protein